MPVIYNSKKIIPAPFFSCLKEYQTADDGSIVGKVYQIQLKGKFVAWMGSPNAAGEFWDQSGYPPDDVWSDDTFLKAQLRKQEAIRRLFSTQGQTFEIQATDGSVSLRCNPRILKIETPEGPLTALSDYIVTMEASSLTVDGIPDDDDVTNDNISKASEEWNMEVMDEKLMTYRLSHSVNAVGKFVYDESGVQVKKPWEYARDYVLNKLSLGLDSTKMTAAGVLNNNAMQAYNYLRGQQVNELTGVFGVNETWVCYDGGAATEEFSINTRTNLEGRSSVSVSGTITGFGSYNNSTAVLTTSRYDNAVSKWSTVSNTLFSRLQTQSGITLNPNAVSKDVGRNQVAGTITYNYEYDDRPASLITGSKSTSISQTDDNAADVFASIPVIGNATGPILQAMGTITSRKRTVSLTAQMAVPTYANPTVNRPNSNGVFPSYIPSGSQVFIERDEEGWTPINGQYTRTVTWVYK